MFWAPLARAILDCGSCSSRLGCHRNRVTVTSALLANYSEMVSISIDYAALTRAAAGPKLTPKQIGGNDATLDHRSDPRVDARPDSHDASFLPINGRGRSASSPKGRSDRDAICGRAQQRGWTSARRLVHAERDRNQSVWEAQGDRGASSREC